MVDKQLKISGIIICSLTFLTVILTIVALTIDLWYALEWYQPFSQMGSYYYYDFFSLTDFISWDNDLFELAQDRYDEDKDSVDISAFSTLSFNVVTMEDDTRYYVDLYLINDEFCLCDYCDDSQDLDSYYKDYCDGIQQMTAGGIIVGILSVFSVFFGTFSMLMPIYHLKKSKCKPCKKLIKSGICLHLHAICLMLAFILFCALIYSVASTINIETIQTKAGGGILIAAFGVVFVTWIYYFVRYRLLLKRAKKNRV